MMQTRKLALTAGKPAPPSWWLLGEEDLSQWVTCCAAKTLSPARWQRVLLRDLVAP